MKSLFFFFSAVFILLHGIAEAQNLADFKETNAVILSNGDSSMASSKRLGSTMTLASDSTLIYHNGQRWVQLMTSSGQPLNLFIGEDVGKQHRNGSFNTMLGIGAYAQDTSGEGNTGIGYFAMNGNRSGKRNVSVGNQALQFSESANDNVAIGNFALRFNSGDSNIGIGSGALLKNQGDANLGLGRSALISNSTGVENIAIGGLSSLFNKTGSGNIAIGLRSRTRDTIGSQNISIGNYAMSEGYAHFKNVVIGDEAALEMDSAHNNVIIGYRSGYNSQGSSNVFIGSEAGYHEKGDNKLYIQNDSSSIPLIYGDFNQDILHFNSTIRFNLPSLEKIELITKQPFGTLFSDPFLKPTAADNGYIGDENYNFFRIYSREFYAFDVASYKTYSDMRIKEDIRPLGPIMKKIGQLRPVTYRMIEDYKNKRDDTNASQHGLIAQEVETIFPELVDESDSGLKHISYQAIIPILIKGMQEQQDMIESLQRQLEEQENKVE